MNQSELVQYLTVEYDNRFVAMSYFTSVVSSYAAVEVLEGFRDEKDRFKQTCLVAIFSLLIGGTSIWYLHFTGMYAISFYHIIEGEKFYVGGYYNIDLTVLSWFAPVFFVFAGASFASKDKFFGLTSIQAKQKAFSEVVSLKELVGKRKHRRKIQFIALFAKPTKFIVGGCIAGIGICIMHFVGMQSLNQYGFRIEWNYALVFLSVIIAVVVASAGFWIVFRLLQWKQENELIRFGSAWVLAAAIGLMHYTGMTAATYRIQHDELGKVPVYSSYWEQGDILLYGGVTSTLNVVFSLLYLVIYSRNANKRRQTLFVDAVGKRITQIPNEDQSLEMLRIKIERVLNSQGTYATSNQTATNQTTSASDLLSQPM